MQIFQINFLINTVCSPVYTRNSWKPLRNISRTVFCYQKRQFWVNSNWFYKFSDSFYEIQSFQLFYQKLRNLRIFWIYLVICKCVKINLLYFLTFYYTIQKLSTNAIFVFFEIFFSFLVHLKILIEFFRRILVYYIPRNKVKQLHTRMQKLKHLFFFRNWKIFIFKNLTFWSRSLVF